MTQVAWMRLLYPVIRLAGIGLSKRRAYMLALDASSWIHARTWCIREPLTWWSWRRRLRLIRRGLWEVQA